MRDDPTKYEHENGDADGLGAARGCANVFTILLGIGAAVYAVCKWLTATAP